MSAFTNVQIKTNSPTEAKKVARLMARTAKKRTPEYPNEIQKFISGIEVTKNSVFVDDNYSLMSNTFRELLPQIADKLVKKNLRAITIIAWFTSCSCGYESEYIGQIHENGALEMTFEEHD